MGMITTIIELVVGFILDKFFNMRLWDYSNWSFNFMGYISLNHSIRFAVFGMVIYYFIKPFLDKRIKNFDQLKLRKINIIILSIMLFDFIVKITNISLSW